MEFKPDATLGYQVLNRQERQEAQQRFEKNYKNTRRLLGRLPVHRELLNKIKETGLQRAVHV